MRKPRSTLIVLMNACAARPPPASSVSASANSITTSARRSRFRPLAIDRPPSLIASARLARAACQAGAQPASTPASAQTPSANNSTGTLRVISVSDGSVYSGIRATIASSWIDANSAPTTPPANASTRLSISSCRAMAPFVAPRAERMASSRCRALPRARRRLATLAQAISSRKHTAARSSQKTLLRAAADEVVAERLDARLPRVIGPGRALLDCHAAGQPCWRWPAESSRPGADGPSRSASGCRSSAVPV